MPSHFSTIGFPVNTQSEFVDLTNRVVDDCIEFDASRGTYLRWKSDSGAALWLQADRDRNLIGMNPHFSGSSVVRVGVMARIIRPDSTALDGAFYGWADPEGANPGSGCYPFVFDSPDFGLHSELELPAIVEAQVAAFAHEISIFDSPDAFARSRTGEMKLGSQSFIPSGLFSPEGESTEPPNAHAILTGHILCAEKKYNELSRQAFYWALVDTFGGIYDIVIDPAMVFGMPKVGGVLSGSFWLSGQLRL